jgi:hypothetical protein
MKFISLILAILTSTCVLVANSAEPDPSKGTVSGFVRDSATREPLIGATVSVRGTKLGKITNKSGFFSIANVPSGKQTVVVSFVGYRKSEYAIELQPGGSVRLDPDMVITDRATEEVVVTADRDEDKREITVSRVNIPMQQIQQMRIGGEADIFRAIQMLPGVLTSSQISSGLFIRGGSPDQNLVLLDGMTVYNPTHLFGFISAFNSDAIKDVELLKGGFPAEYGGRMSAVLNVTQKDGNQDKYEGVLGVGLISSRASVQGPVGNGSFFLGGRRTYLDLVLGLVPEDPENPLPSFNFYDVNAKVVQNIGENDKITLAGFLTSDALSLDQESIDFNIGIGNRAGSLRWGHVFGDDLFSLVTVSASRYRNGFDGNNAGFEFEVQNAIVDYSVKSELEWFPTEAVTVKGGYEATIFNFTYRNNFTGSNGANSGTDENVFELNIWDNIHSVFGQVNYQVTDELSLQGGLRANYWSLSGLSNVDPRLAARYQIADGIAIKGAWGRFHQYLRLASAPDFSFFDTWLPTDKTVPAGVSDHYILALETRPADGLEFNVDLYYKSLSNINELNQTQTRARTVSDVFYIGDGEAYGVELFLQKKMGKLTGWVGYALGWVEATFPDINRGQPFRPKYDRRHDFKVTGMYDLNERWQVGATFVFQSGQSYTGATSQLGIQLPNVGTGFGAVVPSQRWGLRLPNSHQLNLNVNYKTTLFDLPFTLLIDIYNVYSRRDIWFRFYDLNKAVPEVTDVRLLPIIPTVSFELKF